MGKHMRNKSFTKLVAGIALAGTLFIGARNASAVFSDYFDGLSLGDVSGQNGWTASSVFDVVTEGTAPSSPNVVEIVDSSASSFTMSRLLDEPSKGFVSFKARQIGNNLANTSGFFLRMDAALPGSVSPDPFFQIGFSTFNGGISWFTYGPSGGGAIPSIVSNNDWYQFDMYYDISSAATHYVNLNVINLTSLTTVASTNLTMVGNQGARHFLGQIAFETGSTHDLSTFQLDDVVIPEPSVVALAIGAAGMLALRLRRR
jgi:hypothetical protein